MFRNASICALFLLFVGAVPSAAQTSLTQPRWDAGVTAGLTVVRPGDADRPYYQDWYTDGRYAGSIGYYFTKHLKAEFEHAWSGEGSRMLLEYVPVNGQPFPYQIEQFFQLQQSVLRIVWQFGDNAWAHPYVSAGAVLDAERQRFHVHPTYQTDRNGRPIPAPQLNLEEKRTLRAGVSIGGGVKLYMSPRTFFNAGANVTYSKPDRGTVNLLAGFGFDF